jgi:hypothetical protein
VITYLPITPSLDVVSVGFGFSRNTPIVCTLPAVCDGSTIPYADTRASGTCSSAMIGDWYVLYASSSCAAPDTGPRIRSSPKSTRHGSSPINARARSSASPSPRGIGWRTYAIRASVDIFSTSASSCIFHFSTRVFSSSNDISK